MPLRLIKFALSRKHPEPRMFTRHERLKPSYDVVIIGAGGHGCAAAYYLARDHGFSDESVRLWQDLSQDFDLNVFYSTRGHFTLAHTDAAMRTMRWRAEVNRHFGVASEAIDSQAVREAIPMMDITCGGHAPVVGALYHAPGAIARHDAVAWGYARGADRRGIEIHQGTQVLAIELEDHGSGGRVAGVLTNRGRIATRKVLCAVAGYTPRLLAMVGLRSPIYVHPLQAMVSEPLKPWLDPIIVSGSLHVYVSQSARGELVMGASLDPYELHSTRSTLDFAESLAAHMLELFPFLSDVKINRQWAGMADMTPDFTPIMGLTPVRGFYLDSGWGTWGFKATPVCGKTMSHTVAKDAAHPLIEGFAFDRFARYALTGEKGAASVGH